MRSLAEINRDFAGMHESCERRSHGCTYPSCKCSRTGAVPVPKQRYIQCPTCKGHGEVPGTDERMRHDYPILQQFHSKHALGALSAPSCLCCGHQTHPITRPIAVQHMELPAIVVCKLCKDAALRAAVEALAPKENQRVFAVDVLGTPMREYEPGKWEVARWPSLAAPAGEEPEQPNTDTNAHLVRGDAGSPDGSDGRGEPAAGAQPSALPDIEAELRKLPELDDDDVDTLMAMVKAGHEYAADLRERMARRGKKPICPYTDRVCQYEGNACTCTLPNHQGKHPMRWVDQTPADVVIPPAPPECETEDEKTAYAFGYWQGLHATRTTDAAGKDSKTPPDQSPMPPSACTAPATDQRPNIESASAPAADGQAPVARRVHLAQTGDQITEPGWYWDSTAEEFLKIESIEQTVYKPGILRSDYPQHVAGKVKSLLCRGSTWHGDWGGPFVGPLTLANIVPRASPVSAPEPAGEAKPVARLQAMESKDAERLGLYEIVILDRARCHDDMYLYAAPASQRELLRECEKTLWICAEHDALHFGESHNTVIQARAALAKLREHLKDDKAGGAGVAQTDESTK